MTEPTTLRAAGLRMRELQREYFRTRSRDTLIASKAAEKEFDRMLADHALPATAVADHGIPSGVAAAPTCPSCGVLMEPPFFHFRHCTAGVEGRKP